MAGLTNSNRRFLKQYALDYPESEKFGKLAEKLVRSILIDSTVDIHAISSRAKSPDSMLLKILKKSYKNPTTQLTDRIGVRVITYYAADVDKVVNQLKKRLRVDPRRSVDKRSLLGPRSFGYSSVHLIARLRPTDENGPQFSLLSGVWFEIQVRSILEHAWAEIEHEIVFKSEIRYPRHVVRRFAALAGTLEMLNNEFLALKAEKNALIENYRVSYGNGAESEKQFDVSRLLGFLESEQPQNLSWRQAEKNGDPFVPRIEVTCLLALTQCGLTTSRKLRRVLNSRRFRKAVQAYAGATGLEAAGVSHLALIVIIVAIRSRRLLNDFFPKMAGDPGIKVVLSHS